MDGEQDKYRTFFWNVPAMVCFVDFDGRILELNRAWETATGFSRGELAGRPWAGFIHPEDIKEAWAGQKKAMNGEPATAQLRVRCKDGSYKWFLIAGSVDKERGLLYTSASDISALKETETSLRASEHLLRRIIDKAPISMAIVGMDEKIEYINRMAEETFGYPNSEIPTMADWWVKAYPDEAYRREVVADWMGRVMDGIKRNGEIVGNQYRVTCGDGAVKTCFIYGVVAAGKVFVMFDDISERVRAQEALVRVIEQAPIPMAISDGNGRLELLNRRFTQVFGYTRDDIPDLETLGREVYPDEKYRQEVTEYWLKAREFSRRTGGELPPREFRVRCKDGTYRTVVTSSVMTLDDKIISINEDITARKEYEERLLSGEKTLRTILEQAPISIAVHTLEGDVEFTNRKFVETYGYPLEEMPTLEKWTQLAYPDPQYRAGLLEMWGQWVESSMRTGQSMPGTEVRVRCRGGQVKNVFITGVVTPDRKVVSILDDITGRVESERALRERESLYRALVETTRTGYVVIDGQGRVVDANREYVRLAGFSDLKQIMGRSVLDWTAPHERERNAAAVAKCARDGYIHNFEVEYIRRDGALTPVEINATVISRDGVSHILSLCRDISRRRRRMSELRAFNDELEKRVAERTAELKRVNIGLSMEIAQRMDAERNSQKLQQELQRAQKMEALGQLAGGIAHDFNNILVAISGYAEFLMRTLPADSPGRGDLEEIMHETERGAALTHQLSTIGRKEPENPGEVDLNHDVEDACRMLKRLLGAGIRLETGLPPGLPAVCAGVGQVSQLVMNLVLNARDAMPQGGRISVSTGLQEFTGGEGMPITPAPGKYVFLEVKDDGQGMPPETARQAFEPFFTTKEPGKGTGLGLSVVYSIVKQAGGGIGLTTSPGGGTAIRILLPPCAPGRKAPPRRKP